MARTKGSIKLSSNFEPEAGAPFDARTIVPALADLTTAGTFPYPYEGMIVYVQATHDTYQYIGGTITDSASWKKFGSDSESGNNDSQESYEFGVKKLYIGNAGGNTSAGIAYEDVYRECTYPAKNYPNSVYYEIIDNEYVPAVTPPYTEDQFDEIQSRLDQFNDNELTAEEYENLYGTTPAADEQTLQLMRSFNNYKTFYQKSLPRYTIPEVLHGKGEDVIVKIYDLADALDNFSEKVYDDHTYKIATDKSTKYSKGDIIIQLGQYDYEIQIWGYDYIPDASEFPNLLFTKTADGKCSVQKSSTFNTDSVIIPEKIKLNNEIVSVDSIPTGGFSDCSGLVTALLPNSLETIGSAAFSGCSSIKTLSIPFIGDTRHETTDTYQYPLGYIFGTSSFDGATRERQDYYKATTSYTSSDYFYIPNSLRTVIVTDCEYIPAGAFSYCRRLTNINVDCDITSIKDYAFSTCTALSSFKIPNTVVTMGRMAFWDCDNLTELDIPSGVTSIGSNIFYGCGRLNTIIIPSTLTSIGYSAFDHCGSELVVKCEATSRSNGWSNDMHLIGKIIWDYKNTDGYTITYNYGLNDRLKEVFRFNYGDTIPTFNRTLGYSESYVDRSALTFNDKNDIEEFVDYEYSDGEMDESGDGIDYYGYNFLHWVNEADQQVEIPGTMPDHNLEFYAEYEEFYIQGYAMDDPGMEG